MIKGIGNDMVEIERIKKAAEKESFITRWFDKEEVMLFKEKNMRAETIAANFAAKEAFSKALGTGFKGLKPEEICVLRNAEGAPYIVLKGDAYQMCKNIGITKIYVSLSHTKEFALAFVICEVE